MLTADIALLHDPSYLAISKEFAANLTSLDEAFSHAWYKLVSRDMGPVARCRGNDIPPAQPFQNPLPAAPAQLPDFKAVRKQIKNLLTTPVSGLTSDQKAGGKTYNGALFVNLAWQCASTFRLTDYAGGCNGAKIRFSPQKDWPLNAGMDQVIAALESIKKSFPNLSTADLIVLAGQVALEDAGGVDMQFVGGRVDAVDGSNSDHLAPRDYYKDASIAVRDSMKIMGLSAFDTVALAGRLRSPVQQKRLGFKGTYTDEPSKLSNTFFKLLISKKWTKVSEKEYKADGEEIYILDTDFALTSDPAFRQIVTLYASSQTIFKQAFAAAWSKLMTADHYNTDGY
jgi:catalase (peroxidase I)